MANEFIVIKYFERLSLTVPGVPDAWPQWLRVTACTVRENYKSVRRLRTKHIDRQEALRLIRESGLVLAHEDKNGKVWDTPDKTFQKTYKGVSVPQVV